MRDLPGVGRAAPVGQRPSSRPTGRPIPERNRGRGLRCSRRRVRLLAAVPGVLRRSPVGAVGRSLRVVEHSEVVPAVRRLARWEQGYWSLTVYERAGEAGGAFVAAGVRRRSNGIRGAAADPDRARAEAARRAGGKVRRYCAANGLSRLGTLTYGRRAAPTRCWCARMSGSSSGRCAPGWVTGRCRMCGCLSCTRTACTSTSTSRSGRSARRRRARRRGAQAAGRPAPRGWPRPGPGTAAPPGRC